MGIAQAREAEFTRLPDLDGQGRRRARLRHGVLRRLAAEARRARVVGVDVTPAQLDTARRMNAEFGLGLELLQANAEETGLPGDSFDLAVSEYGASIWCDPAKWIPEAARLLRAGGHLVFLRNSTLAILCSTATAGRRRRCNGRSAACTGSSGPSPSDEIEFQLGHGDWIRAPPRERIRDRGARRAVRARRRGRPRLLPLERRVVEEVAVRGDLARPPAAAADPRLDLAAAARDPRSAAASPSRSVAPRLRGGAGDDPVEHAAGKARSVDGERAARARRRHRRRLRRRGSRQAARTRRTPSGCSSCSRAGRTRSCRASACALLRGRSSAAR